MSQFSSSPPGQPTYWASSGLVCCMVQQDRLPFMVNFQCSGDLQAEYTNNQLDMIIKCGNCYHILFDKHRQQNTAKSQTIWSVAMNPYMILCKIVIMNYTLRLCWTHWFDHKFIWPSLNKFWYPKMVSSCPQVTSWHWAPTVDHFTQYYSTS